MKNKLFGNLFYGELLVPKNFEPVRITHRHAVVLMKYSRSSIEFHCEVSNVHILQKRLQCCFFVMLWTLDFTSGSASLMIEQIALVGPFCQFLAIFSVGEQTALPVFIDSSVHLKSCNWTFVCDIFVPVFQGLYIF